MLWSEAFKVSDTALANLKGTRLGSRDFGEVFCWHNKFTKARKTDI